MSDFIGIDITGEKKIAEALEKLPDAVADAGVEAADDYLLKVLREYPPQKYVTRAKAYPETGDGFFTTKQRRWFFWALHSGKINVPYRRTQGLRKGWKTYGTGRKQIIANETPGAQFVQGAGTQSRHEKLVGWQTTADIIEERMDKIIKAFNGAVKKAARKLGLKVEGA
jgi:hypothetical protein